MTALVNKKHLAIIDGSGFIFRAFFSVKNLTTSTGFPIGAIHGLTNMLIKFKAQSRASHIIIVFDTGQKSFRSELYPEYKANRVPCPNDLKPQFPITREAVEALNLKFVEAAGFEADDVIATYARQGRELGFYSTIISSDKDLMQLIDDEFINCYDPIQDKTIYKSDILNKFGVEHPSQILDLLSIVGDSSDNIPGIKGIGPKTAQELLLKYHTLENIYKNIHLLEKKRTQELLYSGRESAILSKKLATLNAEVPSLPSIEDFEVTEYDFPKLFDFLYKYDLKSIASRIANDHRLDTKQFQKQNVPQSGPIQDSFL